MAASSTCWSCGTRGVSLIEDPMGSGPSDKIDVCKKCAKRRQGIADLYDTQGTMLVPRVPPDDFRDDPTYHGDYCVVSDNLIRRLLSP